MPGARFVTFLVDDDTPAQPGDHARRICGAVKKTELTTGNMVVLRGKGEPVSVSLSFRRGNFQFAEKAERYASTSG